MNNKPVEAKIYSENGQEAYLATNDSKVLHKMRRSLQMKILTGTFKKNHKILDIGCGSGTAIQLLASMGYSDIYGVEPDTELVKLAEEKNPLMKGRFKTASALNLPFEKGKFDGVYFCNVFHHIESLNDYKVAINEVLKVLKTGGKLVMIEPYNKYIYLFTEKISGFFSFISFFRNIHSIISEEKKLLNMFLNNWNGIKEHISKGGFEIDYNKNFFHQSVLVATKK